MVAGVPVLGSDTCFLQPLSLSFPTCRRGSLFPPEAGNSNGFMCTFPKRKPCSGPRNRSLSGDASATSFICSQSHTRCCVL